MSPVEDVLALARRLATGPNLTNLNDHLHLILTGGVMARGRPRSSTRTTAETAPCTTCGAPPAQTCTTIGGTNQRTESHIARLRATQAEPSPLAAPCTGCGAPAGVRCIGHPTGPAVRYHLTTLRETT